MDIRSERLAAGMTQSELARAAKVPQPNLSAYENGRRTPSPEVLERISTALKVRPSKRVVQRREEVMRVVTEHHARSPRIFGSTARGEDEPGSDLDLLVDFTDEATLFDEVGLRIELTDLLGIPVDVTAEDTLRGDFGRRILAEAIPL